MDAAELRRLADNRIAAPVTPETALGVWVQVDDWFAVVEDRLSDAALASWDGP